MSKRTQLIAELYAKFNDLAADRVNLEANIAGIVATNLGPEEPPANEGGYEYTQNSEGIIFRYRKGTCERWHNPCKSWMPDYLWRTADEITIAPARAKQLIPEAFE